MFADKVTFFNSVPVDTIRRLREEGHSLADIAKQTGTTVAIVRRLVGKLDRAAIRRRQEEIARKIDAESLTWDEKVERWKAETGMCAVTFWRIVKRLRQQGS